MTIVSGYLGSVTSTKSIGGVKYWYITTNREAKKDIDKLDTDYNKKPAQRRAGLYGGHLILADLLTCKSEGTNGPIRPNDKSKKRPRDQKEDAEEP